MKKSAKLRPLAAGGIVVRETPEQLIAVVRLRKDKSWVLPKGKLKAGEDALVGARREVMEETRYDVSIKGFLGSMSHAEGGKLKVVQFWMRAGDEPVRKLMHDVTGKMVAVATGDRHSHAPARKGIPHKRGSGDSTGRRTDSARSHRRAFGTADS
jgi:8-oxo-dGTP pyrophosphatase MutT (NUDIX family)